MSDRRSRREVIRDRRRAKQFVGILAGDQEKIAELKEERPPDVAIQQVVKIDPQNNRVNATDDVSITTVTDPIMTWTEDKWSETEWGPANVG